MNTVDIVLLAVLALFAISGLYYGFVKTLGSIVGMVAGMLIGSWGVAILSSAIPFFARPLVAIVTFLIIAAIVGWIVGWFVNIAEAARKLVSIIPFLGTINHLLGGIFGLIEGIIILAAVAFYAESYLPSGNMRDQILGSAVMRILSVFVDVAQLLFPHV